MNKKCPIDCRTATTDVSECECSCGGKNHGTQATVTSYQGIESNYNQRSVNPTKEFVTVADVDGFSLDDIAKMDIEGIQILYQDPADGWTKENCKFECVKGNVLFAKKRSGFSEGFEPDQIPVSQFDKFDGSIADEMRKLKKKQRNIKQKV